MQVQDVVVELGSAESLSLTEWEVFGESAGSGFWGT